MSAAHPLGWVPGRRTGGKPRPRPSAPGSVAGGDHWAVFPVGPWQELRVAVATEGGLAVITARRPAGAPVFTAADAHTLARHGVVPFPEPRPRLRDVLVALGGRVSRRLRRPGRMSR